MLWVKEFICQSILHTGKKYKKKEYVTMSERSKYFEEIESRVAGRLKKGRFRHTLGVAHTAACLAMRYGADVDKAYTAGLLHDIAKHMSDKELLKAADKYNISITDFDKKNPDMLHGPVGAKIAEYEFDIKDEDILNAIANHTSGRVGMSLLEEIVFVADYMETGRDKAPNLPEVRGLAFKDIKKCIVTIIENIIRYLEESGEIIDERIYPVLDHYR